MNLDEQFVDALAPNANAIKNGRKLLLAGKLSNLQRTEDESLFFAECAGSGKSGYHCSVDFVDPDNPVGRCSCPSRQFPCKHTLAVLYAIVEGETFAVGAAPADVVEKREKAQTRAAKKTAAVAKPRKVNKSALAKKVQAQLDGMDLLTKITEDVVSRGLGNFNAKAAREVEAHAKQLGNAYLPGAQAALHELTWLFRDEEVDEESLHFEAMERLTNLHTLARAGRKYLEERLADPELAPATDTAIAAWLGHAWELRQLRELGRIQKDVELVQLSFLPGDFPARKEYVDTGTWMDLATGLLVTSQTIRPYRAAKHIKQDDSTFRVACVEELFLYPGEGAPRVRWESMRVRPHTPEDLRVIRGHAESRFAPAIKAAKTQLKAPLGGRYPLGVVEFKRVGRCGETWVIEDAGKERLALTDAGESGEPSTLHLLPVLPKSALENQVLLVRFCHDHRTAQLRAKPLSIVTETDILRLGY